MSTVKEIPNTVTDLTSLFTVIHTLEKAKADYTIQTVESAGTRHWTVQVERA